MNHHFYSDSNHLPHPRVTESITTLDSVQCNDIEIKKLIEKYFNHYNLDVVKVINCTSANTLSALSAVRSQENMLCSDIAHLLHYENDAIKKIGLINIDSINTKNGKICLNNLSNLIEKKRYKLLSITQPTEVGTVYTLEELSSIYKIANANGIIVHIDGARLFYAISFLKCLPGELIKYCDLLTLGLGKFGNAFGDLLVIKSRRSCAEKIMRMKKIYSQGITREDLINAQIKAFFDQGFHILSSNYALGIAKSLADNIQKIGGHVLYPVHANILYVQLPEHVLLELIDVYKIGISSRHQNTIRIVVSYATTDNDINDLLEFLGTRMQ